MNLFLNLVAISLMIALLGSNLAKDKPNIILVLIQIAVVALLCARITMDKGTK